MPEPLDPRKPNHVAIFGRKGEGKSEMAGRLWESYPKDRLVIDPTHDVDPRDPEAIVLTEVPTRWPTDIDGKRVTIHYKPDPGSPTYEDDLDRAVGLAFRHGDCMVWVDEVGETTSAHKTGPNMKRVLHQGRHNRISPMFCGPRPIDINPLVIAQADYVICYQLPNPDDRARVAKVIGWDLPEFEEAHAHLREHWYLWYDARAQELLVCPPIPLRAAAKPEGRRFEDQDPDKEHTR